MDQTDLCYLPATELATRIRARQVSPVEVTDAFLARIERLNPRLNAYCTVTAEEARAGARAAERAVVEGAELGPLHGVPVSIKDLVVTKGVRTTRGSKLYEHWVPDEDAPLVERLKAAGAIVLGKTNTPELGWKGVTDNRVFGVTRNPWDLGRTPGGSSGGAGAAVAAGLGPIGIGTDGGGSIRIPASFCGIFGLKPSYGRIPVYPPSAAETLSHAGPMTRTVRDAALCLDVLAGPDERDRLSLPTSGEGYLAAPDRGVKGLRIAWTPDLGYAVVESEVARSAEASARRFEELGAHVEEVRLNLTSPERCWETHFNGAIGAALAPLLERHGGDLDPGLREIVEEGRSLTALDYLGATFERVQFWNAIRPLFERYDLLLTPSLAVPPFPLGTNQPETVAGRPASDMAWSPFSYPFNLTGQPAAVVPCGWIGDEPGLPVGLQIVGRRHDDATVLRAAAAFEGAAPWADRRPPLE